MAASEGRGRTAEDARRLPDLWAERDYPVLLAVAELVEDGHPPFTSDEVATAADRDESDVVRALINLETRYVKTGNASTLGRVDRYVKGITEDGLREVGRWPSPEAAADRLLAALDDLIDETPEGSPKARRLVRLRDGLADAGRDVLVNVVGAVVTGRIPL